MHTSQNEESEDALNRAYGLKVKELLSQSNAETWIEDLWDMYTAPRRPASPSSVRKRAMIRVDITGS